jgi:hypothetical protein
MKAQNILFYFEKRSSLECFSKQKKILKTSYAIIFLHFGHTEIHSWATSLSPWSELGDKLVGLVTSVYV